MNLLMRWLYRWQKRKMCRCASPKFVVKDRLMCCDICGKPIHKLDVNLGG